MSKEEAVAAIGREPRPLSGRAKVLYEGIFVEKKRLNNSEWANLLYKDKTKINNIYSLTRTLRLKGYPVIPVKKNPDAVEPGALTPLTESRDTTRLGYKRTKDRLDSNLLTYGIYAEEGLAVYPDLKGEVLEQLQDSLASIIGVKKLALSLEEPSAYVKKRLPGKAGSGK